jgi:hypothetical protein
VIQYDDTYQVEFPEILVPSIQGNPVYPVDPSVYLLIAWK